MSTNGDKCVAVKKSLTHKKAKEGKQLQPKAYTDTALTSDVVAATSSSPIAGTEAAAGTEQTAIDSNHNSSLDELDLLERELIQMQQSGELLSSKSPEYLHYAKNNDNKNGSLSNEHNANVLDPPVVSEIPLRKVNNGDNIKEETMKDEDNMDGDRVWDRDKLIALLKGSDEQNEDDVMSGVSIEGEGKYQIMEVIDVDDCNASRLVVQPETSPTPRPPAIAHKKYAAATFLTSEQERALALEQMAGLKSDRIRRRKQDIKTIQQKEIGVDVNVTLTNEWMEGQTAELATNATIGKKNKPSTIKVLRADDDKIKSTVHPAINDSKSATPGNSFDSSDNTDKLLSTASANADEALSDNKKEQSVNSNQTTSGFRRSRVIKRKVIWDPDAPETAISYAKFVKSNVNSKSDSNASASITKNDNSADSTSTVVRKGNTTIRAIKKLPGKRSSSALSKETKCMEDTLNTDNPNTSNNSTVVATSTTFATTSISLTTNTANTNATSTTSNVKSSEESSTIPSQPVKKRSQNGISNGSNASTLKKKKISELDRLMSDEGAFNMLAALANERSHLDMNNDDSENTRSNLRATIRGRGAPISEKIRRRDTTATIKGNATTAGVNSNDSGTSGTATAVTSGNTTATKGKRITKSKPSTTWDYVYEKQKVMDESMIMRRRSNSSYSSNTSLHVLSVDGSIASTAKSISAIAKGAVDKLNASNNNEAKRSNSLETADDQNFKFAKPENKCQQKNYAKSKSPDDTLANDMNKEKTPNKSPGVIKANDRDAKQSSSSTSAPSFNNFNSDILIRKIDKLMHIVINTAKAKIKHTFTIQMMNHLNELLRKLSTDTECKSVVMSTNTMEFCHGVDLSNLNLRSDEKRKHAASTLAAATKNYIKALVNFPKPLVAAVNGSVINFGVLQLAYFDIVVAGEESTFEMPYAKYGQLPEGFCLWNARQNNSSNYKKKLLLLCEKLTANDAVASGLIYKLAPSTKVIDEAINLARQMGGTSTELFAIMKMFHMKNCSEILLRDFENEFDAITAQWASRECFEHLTKLLNLDDTV